MKLFAIAVSGGLDSTICIILFKKLKFNLKGFFFINWKKNIKKLINLINISNILNFKIKILNYYNFYKKKIFKKLIKNKIINNNLNSDNECNKIFKFNIIMKYIKTLKFKKLITGHYSIIKKIFFNRIKISKNYFKDQNYFICNLNLNLFKFLIFPIGKLKKLYIYIFINKIKNFFYKEKESSGICFIENKNFKNLINNFIKKKISYVINYNKIILGLHIGNFFYTIGQKKYLNFYSNSKNLYVYKKFKNLIYINNKPLLVNFIIVRIYFKFIKILKFYLIKIRHSKFFFISKIDNINKKLIILTLNKYILNCSIGQTISIYYKNYCIGGGKIIEYI